MDANQKIARIAGALYLLVTITGLFVLMYVPGKLFVRGNTAATVNNIFVHQSLYQFYIVVGIVSELLFIALVLVVYQLLKGVSRLQAALMVLLVLLSAPLAFASDAYHVATLTFVRGDQLLAVFDKAQREALSAIFLKLDDAGTPVSEIFWGLWLFPLATLVFKSRFLPRFLGVWLAVNGAAYLILSATSLVLPQFQSKVLSVLQPAFFGEMALMLWLLIKGVRVQPSPSPPCVC